MQIIGFNFTKIAAERSKLITKPKITTNIEFTNLKKEKIELLKDSEAIKLFFKYNLTYDSSEESNSQINQGSVIFEGEIILSMEKEESKKVHKSWKKQELPDGLKIPLFNLILKKCTPKAVNLQDEIGMPSHLPLPKLTPKKKDS